MQLSASSRQNPTPAELAVTFSRRAIWSFDRESVIFDAYANGRTIQCVVPQEYLTAPLVQRPDDDLADELFDRRRTRIEAVLRERIQSRASELPTEIVLATRKEA